MLKKSLCVLMAFLIVLTAFCGCSSVNTGKQSIELLPGEIYYNTDNIYINGLFNPPQKYMMWIIEESGLTVKSDYDEKTIEPIEWGWQEFPFTDEEWKAFFEFPEDAIDLSPYEKFLYQPVNDFGFMLFADGEIWYVSFYPYGEEGSFIITDICLLTPAPATKVQYEHAPAMSSKSPFFDFEIRVDFSRIAASCSGGRLVDIDKTYFQLGNNIVIDDHDIIRWSPADYDGVIADGDTVFFSIYQNGDNTSWVYNGKIIIEAIEQKDGRTLYEATLICPDLVLETDKNTGKAYIYDPDLWLGDDEEFIE